MGQDLPLSKFIYEQDMEMTKNLGEVGYVLGERQRRREEGRRREE